MKKFIVFLLVLSSYLIFSMNSTENRQELAGSPFSVIADVDDALMQLQREKDRDISESAEALTVFIIAARNDCCSIAMSIEAQDRLIRVGLGSIDLETGLFEFNYRKMRMWADHEIQYNDRISNQ